MLKPTLTASVAAVVIATASAGPAAAQQMGVTAPAQLTCADIANLEAAHAAALVYYIAGWTDAQAAGTPPTDAMAPVAPDAAAPDTGEPAGNRPVGGLTLSAAAVIQMCLAQPEALISEIIAAQGGSGVLDATTAPAPAAPEEPAPVEPAPAEPAPAEPAPAQPDPEEEIDPVEPTEPAPQQ